MMSVHSYGKFKEDPYLTVICFGLLHGGIKWEKMTDYSTGPIKRPQRALHFMKGRRYLKP